MIFPRFLLFYPLFIPFENPLFSKDWGKIIKTPISSINIKLKQRGYPSVFPIFFPQSFKFSTLGKSLFLKLWKTIQFFGDNYEFSPFFQILLYLIIHK